MLYQIVQQWSDVDVVVVVVILLTDIVDIAPILPLSFPACKLQG